MRPLPRTPILLLTCALAAAACDSEDPTADGLDGISKDDFLGGKADDTINAKVCSLAGLPPDCDPCGAAGWYADEGCDTFCPEADPICEKPEALATDQDRPTSIAVGPSGVYWNSNEKLMRLPHGSTEPEVVFTQSNTAPVAIVLDDTHIYFGLNSDRTGNVVALPIEGGQLRDLLDTRDVFDLDLDADNVYATTFSGSVWRLPKGEVQGTRLARDQHDPDDVAVQGNDVYWTDSGFGHISTAPVDGSKEPDIFDGAHCDHATSVVANDTHVFWICDDAFGEKIHKKLRQGAGFADPEVLINKLKGAHSLAIDDSHIYWVNRFEGTVDKMPLEGGTLYRIASGQDEPINLVIDDDSVYWVNMGDGRVMRHSK